MLKQSENKFIRNSSKNILTLNKKINLFNIYFDSGSYSEIVSLIIEKAKIKKSAFVCFANAHMVVESYRKLSFSEVLARADIITMDGLPLVWANKWINRHMDHQRVAGIDVMESLLDYTNKNKLSVFFYGSTEYNLSSLKNRCLIDYPNIEIYSYSPPFRPLDIEEQEEVCSMINSYNPFFVFVSLGCPKQEIWMDSMKGKINSLMLGVGYAFLTSARIEKRAPKWMQKSGLEWFFRLSQEPRRLWKRYLYTNSFFIFLVVKCKVLSLLKSS